MKRRHATIIVSVAIMIAFLIATQRYSRREEPTTFRLMKQDELNVSAEEEKSATSKSIKIPCFDTLIFRAGRTAQAVKLSNPVENQCFFQIRIILPDGRTIYNSDLLAPSEEITSIQINTSLLPGLYEGAILQYTCYSLDGLNIINGTDVKFTLEVR